MFSQETHNFHRFRSRWRWQEGQNYFVILQQKLTVYKCCRNTIAFWRLEFISQEFRLEKSIKISKVKTCLFEPKISGNRGRALRSRNAKWRKYCRLSIQYYVLTQLVSGVGYQARFQNWGTRGYRVRGTVPKIGYQVVPGTGFLLPCADPWLVYCSKQ